MIQTHDFERHIGDFFGKIALIKLAIGIHKLISDNQNAYKFENFFGCLQSIILNRLVLVELFNIFDSKRNNITLKKLANYIACPTEKNQFSNKTDEWEKILSPLKPIRDKYVCHFDDFDIITLQRQNPEYSIDYNIILPLLNELENYLVKISSEERHQVRKIDDFIEFHPVLKEFKELVELAQ